MKTKYVVVVPYAPQWPLEFEKIAQPVRRALGGLCLRVEHVGSTSVPGLWAKAIIDLDVVIRREDFSAAVQALAGLGYTHQGDLGIPDREAFDYSGKPELMRHHLYVCPEDSAELRRHTALRDTLCRRDDLRKAYSRVKQEGARRFPADIDGYLAYKSEIIREIYTAAGVEGEP